MKRGTKKGECLDDSVDVRYLGVQEYHKDGSIHFHVLCHIPNQHKALLKKKWQHSNLDFKRSNNDPLEVLKIANQRYLSTLAKGYLSGLMRIIVHYFIRKIVLSIHHKTF